MNKYSRYDDSFNNLIVQSKGKERKFRIVRNAFLGEEMKLFLKHDEPGY